MVSKNVKIFSIITNVSSYYNIQDLNFGCSNILSNIISNNNKKQLKGMMESDKLNSLQKNYFMK